MPYIYGRNPVLEALRHGKPVQKIYLQHGQQQARVADIYKMAGRKRVQVVNADPGKLRNMVGEVTHQGVVALVAEIPLRHLEDLLTDIVSWPAPFTLVVVDQIQDPHNLGAIIRSAEVLGARGVVLSPRDTAPVTDTVVKASAGAVLHCPVYQVPNLAQLLPLLKEQGVWICGTALDAESGIWESDLNRNLVVIIGNEERGMRPTLRKQCDLVFRIPQSGHIQSLNASVATGVVLSEVLRQRRAAATPSA